MANERLDVNGEKEGWCGLPKQSATPIERKGLNWGLLVSVHP